MTELQQRYEAETGQSAIECIDVSKPDRRIITRASESFLEWADRFASESDHQARYCNTSGNSKILRR